jgi:hypothetical protein
MGTDIHGRLQYRYRPDSPYIDAGAMEDDRNYRVFAMLAGVRNGFGFAGIETHTPLQPISEPRGLPADAEIEDGDSIIVMADGGGEEDIRTRHWLGDHSHSWLTLREILDWNGWDSSLDMRGVVSRQEFERIEREGGSPNSWSGGVWGGTTTIVSPEEARAGVDYTDVNFLWQEPFRNYAQTFRLWVDYLERKYGWLLESDPAAVRIVFGFDS